MLTRLRRSLVEGLLDHYKDERSRLQAEEANSASSNDTAAAVRKLRKKERAAIKAKNAWSTRRKHGPGIVKLVVGLRFGEVGSLQPTDWRYS